MVLYEDTFFNRKTVSEDLFEANNNIIDTKLSNDRKISINIVAASFQKQKQETQTGNNNDMCSRSTV